MSHQCPRDGCTRVIGDDRRLMCGPDWKLVPAPLQSAVYRAYKRGAGLGSAALLAAQDAAIRYVNRESGPAPEPAPVRPSPFELWQQSGGNRELYLDLMREHGHLLSPGDPGYDESAGLPPCGREPR